MDTTELEQKYREVMRLKNEQADAGILRAAKAAAHAALGKRADEITQAIAERVRNDPSIQQLLADVWLAAYIANDQAVHPYGLQGGVMWAGAIEAVFPCPDDAMIEAREAAFRAEHGVPLLASLAAE